VAGGRHCVADRYARGWTGRRGWARGGLGIKRWWP